jgi:multiple sugar transport system substrate-binding protein
MKKIFLLFSMLTLSIMLFACGQETVESEIPTETDTVDTIPSQDMVTITYAAWNLGNESDNGIERRMIQAFMEKYPYINVEVIERPRIADEEGNETDVQWDEFFATQASIGKMPDVFQSDSVIKAVLNGWAEELTSVASLDTEYLEIAADIRNASTFQNRVFALPQAMFYMGYFINRTAIGRSSSGAIIPEYGITFSDLMAAAEINSRQPVLGGDGIAGIDGVYDIVGWLPAQFDSSLGWFTYNEEGFHFDSLSFRLAIDEVKKYYGSSRLEYSSFVLEAQDNVDDRYGVGSVFENGKQSIKWGGSFNLRNWLAMTLNPESGLFGADIDFIGTPSVDTDGVNVHRIPIILDYIAVGQGTKNLNEAYLFAKWMGFGKDGYLKRLEIAENNPEAGAVNFAPILQDSELLDQYFELYPTLIEYEKIVRNHQDFIIESIHKSVPGYVNVRWQGQYDANRNMSQAFDDIIKGNLELADALQAGLNTLANQYFNEVKNQLNQALGN